MKTPSNLLAAAACVVLAAMLAGCGSPSESRPPDFAYAPGQPGQSGGDGGYGNNTHSDAGTPPDLAPNCDPPERLCAHAFSWTFTGSMQPDTVAVRGSFDNWGAGAPMTLANGVWTATTDLPWGSTVEYKFMATWNNNPTQPLWTTDPNNTDVAADGNSQIEDVTCTTYTCAAPPPAPSGVFDWRDAVIYFVFVDRFFDGNSANNCHVANTSSTLTNYMGGDWAGVKQKIDAGYFNDLGVNTLWITVPIKNADTVAGKGANDNYYYSAYHGYWPTDPAQVEPCFGSSQDLKDLVDAAHARNLKVLFDYAMVHVHTSSAIYSGNPSWFTSPCVCGTGSCGNFDNYTCWFTDYLAHYDYSNSAACTFSVNAAIQLILDYGNDAFRLDAIKQVDPHWMASLRPAIASQVTALETPAQRFYMVGETYDFQNRALLRSLIDPTSQLDGQFDFPLRIRLVEAILMRRTDNMLTPDDTNWSRNAPAGMEGLAQFMDSNDGAYPSNAVMSTFIGNHDLPRSIHYAEDTPFWSDSATDGKTNSWSNQPQLSTNPRAYERMANAFAVMLTNKGAPLIYYGDEIGLPGAGDPDNRRMMQWSGYNSYQQGLHDRIKALAAIRAAHPALRYGQRQTLTVTTDLWLYKLTTFLPSADTVYVAVNRSDNDLSVSALPGVALSELLTAASLTGPNATIPARQARIFVAQ